MTIGSSSLLVSVLSQEDNEHFSILWSDGKKQMFRLKDLQLGCPCAKCTENRQKGAYSPVKEVVLAHYIESVGRYALRIQFTSGCSQGIYSFPLLRRMGTYL